jgi:inorganic pyrophosphatase
MYRARRMCCLGAIFLLSLVQVGRAADELAPGCKLVDQYTVACAQNLWSDVKPTDAKGDFYAVVEIPRGTTGKWNVEKDGTIKWEMKGGKPRIVDYQGGYPFNYGISPRTMMTEKLGGDGTPCDVVIIGDPLPRGTVARIKIIGMLKLLDGGAKDSKIMAVVKGSPEDVKVNSVDDLNALYKGQGAAIEQWFSNYKGPGKIQSKGYNPAQEAYETFLQAAKAFNKEEK